MTSEKANGPEIVFYVAKTLAVSE
jgi:hypothetical protein